uniref:Uncharacterized protein n=1 Tax=Cacopsylla melanoneura TaxID=428564 RepID=A0A8D8WGW5_9HEMI
MMTLKFSVSDWATGNFSCQQGCQNLGRFRQWHFKNAPHHYKRPFLLSLSYLLPPHSNLLSHQSNLLFHQSNLVSHPTSSIIILSHQSHLLSHQSHLLSHQSNQNLLFHQ